MTKFQELTNTKFATTTDLVDYLFANNFIFKVDPETQKDIYIRDDSQTRNKTYHYTVAEKDGYIILLAN